MEIKKSKICQDWWFAGIQGVFLLAVLGITYPDVYLYNGFSKVTNYFEAPIQLALNTAILIAVIVMRFVINATPDMFPNESMIIIHCMIFTVVTSSYIYERTYKHKMYEA